MSGNSRAPADAPARFPPAQWDGSSVQFSAETAATPSDCLYAVVVFARARCGWVLARVPRGWCVPSGRMEEGETPEQTAVRETFEEIGARVKALRRIGWFRFEKDGAVRVVPAFVGCVEAWGDLPAGSEAEEVRCFSAEALPPVYWRWDALMEAVFRYAEACILTKDYVDEPGGDSVE